MCRSDILHTYIFSLLLFVILPKTSSIWGIEKIIDWRKNNKYVFILFKLHFIVHNANKRYFRSTRLWRLFRFGVDQNVNLFLNLYCWYCWVSFTKHYVLYNVKTVFSIECFHIYRFWNIFYHCNAILFCLFNFTI